MYRRTFYVAGDHPHTQLTRIRQNLRRKRVLARVIIGGKGHGDEYMRRWNVWITAGLVIVIVIGTYIFAEQDKQTESGSYDPQVVKQLVNDLSTRTVRAESASITSTELIVKDENSTEKTYDLPEDEFFLSIAPYIETTHPCQIHSLTSCQGEMTGQEFSVSVIDEEGNAVMDQAVLKSQTNGFIDLWLPRDQTYQITIEHEGKKAQSEISTFDSDDTCIATMQLG